MDRQPRVFLLNVTGQVQPNLVAKVTGTLAQFDINVLDIGQAVIHDHIALGILVEAPRGREWAGVMKELLFQAHELDVRVRSTEVPIDEYERWVAEQGREHRIITMMGRKLTASQISAVTSVCAQYHLNVDVITRLSGRVSLMSPARFPKACVQLSVSGNLADDRDMRRELMDIAHQAAVDISFHIDDIYRRNRRLVAFDMDSTLVQCEVIDELAKIAGVGTEVAAVTEATMQGRLDFSQSLRRRVKLLAGLEESTLARVADDLPLTEGAERVVGTLKRLGYKTAILSGGFDYFGRRLQQWLDIDYVHANQLEIVDGRLTGNVVGEIIDGARKAQLLREIAFEENLTLEQTIAVGDGANDLPMLSSAGMGVAFHAKPVVREQAARSISTVGLDGLLFLIGIREREISGQNRPQLSVHAD